MAHKCKECGCVYKKCSSVSDHDVHLHVEIENLKQRLVDRENHIVTMETNFLNEANKFPNGELVAIQEELLSWQDKYGRLYDAHRRVQRVNQGLEDKLLRLVDVCETDKGTLTKDVAVLSQKLAEANYTIKKLNSDNERYKNDVSLAIQFLQCKQSNFVARRFDSLPTEVQTQISSFMTNKKKPDEKKPTYEPKSIKVPIPTFPPTAMVYSLPKNPSTEYDDRLTSSPQDPPQVDIVSAAIMARVLEERQKEMAFAKHCDTCTCSKKLSILYSITHHSLGTQTNDEDAPAGSQKKCNCDDHQQVRLTRHEITPPANTQEATDSCQQVINNVVKVQPNNFLVHASSPSSNGSAPATLRNSNSNSSNRLKICHPDVNFFNVDETADEVVSRVAKKSPKLGVKLKQTPNAPVVTQLKETDVDNCGKAEDVASNDIDRLKGPRHCSMRLQEGTKNILLDNAHNNVAPVLYTRHNNPHHLNHKIVVSVKESQKNTTNSSLSGDELKKHTSILSESSSSSPTANRQQQRVADWIQSNLDAGNSSNEMSSTHNSQSEPVVAASDAVKNEAVDKAKYREMEENVKKFLFGFRESEFLKTVESGKLKYQNYRESDANGDSSRSNSHTETQII